MLRQKPRLLKTKSFKLTAAFFSLLIFLAVQAGYSQNPAPQQLAALELGKPLEDEIAAKEKRGYQITLAENQYAFITVEQRGIDIAVRVFNKTDNRALVQKDLILTAEGREEIGFVAATAGVYRLEIEAKAMSSPTGRYTVLLKEIRPPTATELHLEEGRKLHNDAILLWRAGKYAAAIPVSERSLAIREEELGAEDLDVAASLANLALITSSLGDYEKAISLQQRAVKIREKIYGPYHADISRTLHNMADAYFFTGNYEESVRTYERVIEIEEKVLGAESAETADTFGNLGEVYRVLGDYAKAEQFLSRALAIKEKTLPPNSVITAFSLSALANLYADKEDVDKALEFNQRALAMWEKTSGPNHPNTALGLTGAANIYRGKGDYKSAEAYYLRALDILQKAFGQSHLRIANTFGNLAVLYKLQGDYTKAESYSRQAIAMFEKTIGKESRNYALALYFLAAFYTDTGEYEKAKPLYEQAIAVTEKVFGSQHPKIILYFDGLARNYEAQGDTAQALNFWTRARQLAEQKTRLMLSTNSERQKLLYINSLSGETNQYVSAHLKFAPDNSAALELALTTILERKGRVADAMASDFAALRGRFNQEDQVLLDQLKDVTARLARKILNEPPNIKPEEYQKQIKELEEQKEKLEIEISRRSSEFRSRLQPVTISSIRAAIPENAALIEFSVYYPYDPKMIDSKAYGEPRYVAYVVRKEGAIRWKDLGATQTIDAAIENFRQSLRDPKRKDVRQLARAVDEKVMQPVRGLIGSATQLLISPDGELNLIPFEALTDERNHYLVENYSFVYLSSGRDLLRMQVSRASKSKSLVIANPSFGEPLDAQTARVDSTRKGNGRRSITAARNLSDTYFAPLGGTLQEARSIQALFPDAESLTGAQATETALKQTTAPRILHIATHGFFLEDTGETDPVNKSPTTRGINANARTENPLLRSGLAFAGANQRNGIEEDGILTALEAASLNLWGTKLVVLSACDTGLGEVKNGEGVYGLRRAFFLAGAESMVISLWSVSDLVTRELMTNYYRNLKQGIGRGAALRQVQLEMLKKNGREHPFYWAGFIQSGEWTNLDGTGQ